MHSDDSAATSTHIPSDERAHLKCPDLLSSPGLSRSVAYLDALDLFYEVPLHEAGQAGLQSHVDVAPPQHGEGKLLDVGAEHRGTEVELMVAQSLSGSDFRG